MTREKSKEDFKKIISENLKKYRKARELTLQTLADKTSYTRGYLGVLESGNHCPNSYILYELSKALNVPIGIFYGETESMLNDNNPLLNENKGEDYIKVIEKAIEKNISPQKIEQTIELLSE